MKRILIMGLAGEFGRDILRGIDGYFGQSDQWDLRVEYARSDEIERTRVAIRVWGADGILAAVNNATMARLIRASGLPAVNFSAAMDSDVPAVRGDSVAIGRLVARHFIENGLKHFGFCAMTCESYARERCCGFTEELTGAGLTCDTFKDHYKGVRETNWVLNRRRMARWLASLPKPVGVMCIHDMRGREVLAVCRQLGLRVPDDIAVVSVGNEEILCRVCRPALSSVDIDRQRVGFEAAGLLGRLIHGRKPPKEPILIPPRGLVARQSSNVVAIDDPEISDAIRFIREHACEPITVKSLLQEVPVSRRSMEIRFLKLLGHTPREELTRLRIARAKQLLAETGWSIPAVAQASGFTGPESFYQFFRREVGLPPTHYRHQCRLTPDVVSREKNPRR